MNRGLPAVIIAAGSSERLGQHKALVEWNGETLIKRSARLLQESGCSPIIVVSNNEIAVDCMIECPDATIVINQNPSGGRTGSIQLGLMSLCGDHGRPPRSVLIVPVDRCGWNLKTIDVLLNCSKTTSPTPSGHPLLLCGDDVEEVLAALPDEPLRDLVRFSRIEAPGIHLNIDKPADLEALE